MSLVGLPQDIFPTIDVSRWCPGARYAIVSGAQGVGNVQRVVDQSCLLVGCLLVAGAAVANIKLFNEKAQTSVAPSAGYPDAARQLPSVKAAVFDGWVNFPVTVTEGIIATIDQADAIAWVFYIPLPSSAIGSA